MFKLVIDMMGGDNGVNATIEGVKKFLNEVKDCEIIAVGDEKALEPVKELVTIVPSQSVVPMECSVMQAMRQKDSSVFKAVSAVNEMKADGVVSAGSTGAFLSLTTLINKKIPGVERPALITPFPSKQHGKYVVLLDVGASAENSPEDLLQFAKMGSEYYKAVFGKKQPVIRLICNGTEEGKGNYLSKEAYKLLKETPGFAGYVEGRDAFTGETDVVVMDGFTGNVMLKTAEGIAKMMGGFMKESFKSSLSSKIGYLLSKKGFKPMLDTMNYKKVGGALLLGVNTIAVKAHGNSDADSFCASLMVAYNLIKNGVVDKIKKNL